MLPRPIDVRVVEATAPPHARSVLPHKRRGCLKAAGKTLRRLRNGFRGDLCESARALRRDRKRDRLPMWREKGLAVTPGSQNRGWRAPPPDASAGARCAGLGWEP